MARSVDKPPLSGPEEAPDLSLADDARALKALDAKFRSLSKEARTPAVTRKFALHHLQYADRALKRLGLHDGDLNRVLRTALERGIRGRRDLPFAFPGDELHKPQGDRQYSQIEAWAAAILELAYGEERAKPQRACQPG